MVLDCGTGARALGGKLLGEPGRELDLLFTHFHLDHVFGFPFFAPIYVPGYEVRVTVPAHSQEEAQEKIARYLNGIYHPTRLRDLPSSVSFHAIRPDRVFDRGGYTISGMALNHPGGSVGYRLEADGESIVYFTDSAPFARPGEGLSAQQEPTSRERRAMEFLQGADVVIYDTMFTYAEYLERMTWGHTYPEYAVALCEAANVKHLVLFHHAPERSDEQIDAQAAIWSQHSGLRVTCAREGESVSAAEAQRGGRVPIEG
jgi:phosphoribosyl 1,2-cyclic phosphodiesterase